MSQWLQEPRLALRRLLAAPTYSLLVVALLGLGLGTNGAIWLLREALLRGTLPGVDEPERLVALFSRSESQSWGLLSVPDFRDYRARSLEIEKLAAYSGIEVALRGSEQVESIEGQIVSENYFSVLGVEVSRAGTGPPTSSPFFAAYEVVLAHDVWHGRFAGKPDIVGETLVLNGHPFTVVGVAPEGFRGTDPWEPAGLWLPLAAHRQAWPWIPPELLEHRGAQLVIGVGRLRPGADLAQASRELAAIAASVKTVEPDPDERWTPALVPAAEGTIWPADRAELGTILGTLGVSMIVLLLVVCLIVAGLTMGRMLLRGHEMGVRAALGAKPTHLWGSLLSESLLLALAGTSVASALAVLFARLLTSFPMTPHLAVAQRVAVTPKVAVGLLGLGLASCGLWALPALAPLTRRNLVRRIFGSAILGAENRFRRRLQEAFIVTEVALSVVLLVTAGLVLASWGRLASRPLGFETTDVSLLYLDVGGLQLDEGEEQRLYGALLDRVTALPTVEHAALAATIPLGHSRFARDIARDPGSPAEHERFNVSLNIVTPGYFDTLRIPRLRGRDFHLQDRSGAPRVAMVNQSLAQWLWPGQDPLGRIFGLRDGDRFSPVRVVGIVADSQSGRSLVEHPEPHLYLPFSQAPQRRMVMLVKARKGSPLLPTVRRELSHLEPDLPLEASVSLEEHVEAATAKERTGTVLLGTAGGISLLLTGSGIFAFVALAFHRRQREIALRMALGANRREMMRRLIGRALLLCVLGLIPGFLLARLSRGLLTQWVTDLAASSLWIYVGVTAMVVVVTFAASFSPAYRVARLELAEVLKSN